MNPVIYVIEYLRCTVNGVEEWCYSSDTTSFARAEGQVLFDYMGGAADITRRICVGHENPRSQYVPYHRVAVLAVWTPEETTEGRARLQRASIR